MQRSPLPFILILLIAACTSANTPDARYVGSATPLELSDSCRSTRAVLRLRNGVALFIPDETTWSLPGTAAANGALKAERTALGANKQPYATQLTGTWTAQTATGRYTTPRCTYDVTLTRS